jgi:hypothetical protein
MVEGNSVLYVLDVLEARRMLGTRRVAVLAGEARKVRDSMLEELPAASLGQLERAPGAHNSAASFTLNDVLARKPEFIALRRAIVELPRDMRELLWAVMQIGRGDAAIVAWDKVLATGSTLTTLLTTWSASPTLRTVCTRVCTNSVRRELWRDPSNPLTAASASSIESPYRPVGSELGALHTSIYAQARVRQP